MVLKLQRIRRCYGAYKYGFQWV